MVPVGKTYVKTVLTTLPTTSVENVCLDITQSALVRTFLSELLATSFSFENSSLIFVSEKQAALIMQVFTSFKISKRKISYSLSRN